MQLFVTYTSLREISIFAPLWNKHDFSEAVVKNKKWIVNIIEWINNNAQLNNPEAEEYGVST